MSAISQVLFPEPILCYKRCSSREDSMPSQEVLHMYATPSSRDPIRIETEQHREEIAATAHLIHLRRHLMAEGDSYQESMIAQTSPQVLAQRDWLLAESIIKQQNTAALEALHHSYADLYRKKYGMSPTVDVYPQQQMDLAKTA